MEISKFKILLPSTSSCLNISSSSFSVGLCPIPRTILASSSYETLPESSWSNNLNRSLISEILEIQFHFSLNMKTVFDKYNKVIYKLLDD